MSVTSTHGPGKHSRGRKIILYAVVGVLAACCAGVVGGGLWAKDQWDKFTGASDERRGADAPNPGPATKTPAATHTRTPSQTPSITSVTPPILPTPEMGPPSPEGPLTGAVALTWARTQYEEQGRNVSNQYDIAGVVATGSNGVALVGIEVERNTHRASSDEVWVEEYEIKNARTGELAYEDNKNSWDNRGTNSGLAGRIAAINPNRGTPKFVNAEGRLGKGKYTLVAQMLHKTSEQADKPSRETTLTYSFRFNVDADGAVTLTEPAKLKTSGAQEFESGDNVTKVPPHDITPAAYRVPQITPGAVESRVLVL